LTTSGAKIRSHSSASDAWEQCPKRAVLHEPGPRETAMPEFSRIIMWLITGLAFMYLGIIVMLPEIIE
jgi:hypothetical protein